MQGRKCVEESATQSSGARQGQMPIAKGDQDLGDASKQEPEARAEVRAERVSRIELQGRRLEFLWQGDPFHIDAEAHPSEAEKARAEEALLAGRRLIEVEVLPGAIELWLPTLG